jgi:iron-sulfur cluster repair protein YtfE (RIC family)
MEMISGALTTEHRDCDHLFSLAEKYVCDKDWGKALEHFQRFSHELNQHFTKEEQILFPELEKESTAPLGPIRVMRMEHEDMRKLINEMENDIAKQDSEHYLGVSETLLILMRQHNMKEENILYPMADDILRTSQADILDSFKSADLEMGITNEQT